MGYMDDDIHGVCSESNGMAKEWARGFNDGLAGARHEPFVTAGSYVTYMDGYRAGRKVDLCERFIDFEAFK